MLMVTTEELFNILGNETRRMILEMLAERPRYTTEIANELRIGQKAINEHLKLMRDLGLIELYVQKQERGSPRKYFRIYETFKMEFTLSPNFFDIDIVEVEYDLETLLKFFPELENLRIDVERIAKIQKIEQMRVITQNLHRELEKLNSAKLYIENLLREVRGKCFDLIKELELDDFEKRVLLEVVTSGGKSNPDEIAEKLRVTPEEIDRTLDNLEKKRVISRR
ncbi:MAG: ArsR/SmtB family transcription factor [Candidatus Methanofastidiosia archaeon]